MGEDETKFNVDLYRRDRAFLDAEEVRIVNERFEAAGELERPSRADVVSELLDELRQLRDRVDAYEGMAEDCECGACRPVDDAGDKVRLL